MVRTGSRPSPALRRPAPFSARQAHLLLLVSVLIWGTMHPISKLLFAQGLTPWQIALDRLGLSALSMIVVAGATGRLARLGRYRVRDLFMVAGVGFLGYFVSITLGLLGLSFLPASMNSLLSNSSPLFVALLAPLLLGERPTRRSLCGLVAGFSGVAILVLSRGGPGGDVALVGVGLSLLSSACWAVYTTVSRRTTARVDPVVVSLVASCVSVIPLAVIVVAEGQLDHVASAPPLALVGLLWLGIIATGLTFLVWTSALRRLKATSVAAYSYLIPVIGVITAAVVLGEQPTPLFLLGSALVLGGVAVAQR
jgi:drug/metabolite transporter (DMT)-like permease